MSIPQPKEMNCSFWHFTHQQISWLKRDLCRKQRGDFLSNQTGFGKPALLSVLKSTPELPEKPAVRSQKGSSLAHTHAEHLTGSNALSLPFQELTFLLLT